MVTRLRARANPDLILSLCLASNPSPTPNQVWVALDEMVPELGPLEYVSGSHLWGDGRSGTASHCFDLLVVRVYG